MKATIHVWIWKCDEKFFIIAFAWFGRCIKLIDALFLPFRLNVMLNFLQEFNFKGSLSLNSSLCQNAQQSIKHSKKYRKLFKYVYHYFTQMVTLSIINAFDAKLNE